MLGATASAWRRCAEVRTCDNIEPLGIRKGLTDMRALLAKIHRVCVREKGHLLIGTGYIFTTFWHSSTLMSVVYGVAAIMGTHVIHRKSRTSEVELRHTPKHLARS